MAGGGSDPETPLAALAAFGVSGPELDEAGKHLRKTNEPLSVYPENWLPKEVAVAMQTQWRVGVAGATGLDYAVLPAVMDLIGVKKKQRKDVFEALRVIEAERLVVMAERRAQRLGRQSPKS